jgi:hypothetical protein
MLKDKEKDNAPPSNQPYELFLTQHCRITISPPTQHKMGTTYKNNPLIFNSRIQVDFWVPKS